MKIQLVEDISVTSAAMNQAIAAGNAALAGHKRTELVALERQLARLENTP